MPTENQLRVQQLLDKLVAETGFRSAALVTRDGLAIVERGARLLGSETFSAMVAALAGAAETALLEAGHSDIRRIVVESTAIRLVILGVSEQTLLVVLTEPSLPLKDAVGRAEASLSAIQSAVGR